MTDKAKSNRMALDNGQIEPALDTPSDAGHGIPSVNVAPSVHLWIDDSQHEHSDECYYLGFGLWDCGVTDQC